MKNILKSLLTMLVFFLAITVNAQNSNVKIKAEKVAEGVKITTTENGEENTIILDFDKAEEYLKKYANNIEIDVKEENDQVYKITYSSENGERESVEIDFENLLENLNVNFEDLTETIKNIASSIEYEETIDENGKKVYKLKSIQTEDE